MNYDSGAGWSLDLLTSNWGCIAWGCLAIEWITVPRKLKRGYYITAAFWRCITPLFGLVLVYWTMFIAQLFKRPETFWEKVCMYVCSKSYPSRTLYPLEGFLSYCMGRTPSRCRFWGQPTLTHDLWSTEGPRSYHYLTQNSGTGKGNLLGKILLSNCCPINVLLGQRPMIHLSNSSFKIFCRIQNVSVKNSTSESFCQKLWTLRFSNLEGP